MDPLFTTIGHRLSKSAQSFTITLTDIFNFICMKEAVSSYSKLLGDVGFWRVIINPNTLGVSEQIPCSILDMRLKERSF